MKKFLALLLALVMVFALAACGTDDPGTATTDPQGSTAPDDNVSTEGASVYYLNFKPEQDAQWQELAAYYTEQTGVPVTVATYASGEYETMLTSEMAKDDAPTMFQVNGPVGLNSWKDYCYDLSGSALYGELTSDDYALKNGDEVAGIAYVIESYGIIVNQTLLQQAGYTVEDIQSFDDLKAVAEDITARSGELGFSAFTSAGMDSSSDWRFKTHLANLPIYFEYRDKGITSTDAIDLRYTSPATVDFTVSRWTEKDVPVQAVFEGSVAEGYQRGEFSITPETITISGQEELVDQVQYAQVTVSQQELTSTYSEQCPVTLIDPNGNPVTGANIQAQPETVLVTLPVEILKEVPLTVNLIDGGGATADNAKVTFSPTDTIMVSGDQADVEGLKEISLGDIKLADVYGTNVFTKEIELSPELTNVSGITEVNVTVTIQGLATRTMKVGRG